MFRCVNTRPRGLLVRLRLRVAPGGEGFRRRLRLVPPLLLLRATSLRVAAFCAGLRAFLRPRFRGLTNNICDILKLLFVNNSPICKIISSADDMQGFAVR